MVWGMPEYEHVKIASKGVLDSPNSLHYLFLIVALGEGAEWRKHYEIPQYPQEMEVGQHPVLQPINRVYLNEIC